MTYIQMRATFIALLVVCMGVTSFAQLQPPPIDWERTYGGSDGEGLCAFGKAYDSGYIFIANTSSTDGDVVNPGGLKIWIVKLDNAGNIEWQKTFAPNFSNTPYYNGISLNKTFDSSYIISKGSILKISKSGDSLWERSYNMRKINYIVQTSDSCYIACGYNIYLAQDIWVAKLDSIGNIIWEYTIPNDDYDEAYTVVEGNNKEILVSGIWTQVSAFQERISFKLDSNGNFIKYLPISFATIHKTYDNNFIATASPFGTHLLDKTDTVKWHLPLLFYTIQQTLDSGFVAGNNYSPLNPPNPFVTDLRITKINSNGNTEWAKDLGGSGNEAPGFVIQINDSSYLIAASTNSYDGDITFNHGASDVWVVKLGKPFYVPPPTNTTTVSKGKNILAYPTITKDHVYIILPKDATATAITLLNYSGQIIAAPVSGYKNEYAIDLHTIAAGNYLLQVTYHSVTETIKVIRQ